MNSEGASPCVFTPSGGRSLGASAHAAAAVEECCTLAHAVPGNSPHSRRGFYNKPLGISHSFDFPSAQMAWIRSVPWTALCALLLYLWTGDAGAQGFDSYGLSLRTDVTEDTILVANNGLRAPFGRSVYIDPINDLVIQVQPGDRCSVTVLDSDPLSQRPGHLSPKKFPCEFGPNDVKYSHFGSRSPPRDRIRLQLRYGKLVGEDSLGSLVNCDDFINANVRYQHTFALKSPNRDYIPMLLELSDKEGNLLKQEFFQILVRIKEGMDNTAPKPSFVAMMMMEVDQFVMTAITTDMLAAEDIESNPDELIFNITSPLSFEEGYIVSTDDRNLPITSFYQGDLKDLKIAYKPPAVDSEAERIFQIELEVVDTEGAVSDPFAFMIVVKPMNTLAPVVTRNTGQLLYEGQSRPLSSLQNLEISDEDNLENVRITVVAGLRHGLLTVPGSIRKFFTPADLDAGVVIYQHDGSDTYSDNIIFRMTDGTNEVEFLFPITVVPTDDEPPIINANTGVQDDNDPPNQSEQSSFIIKIIPIDDLPPELFPGTTLQMTVHEYQLTHFRKKILRYSDLDSEDRDLKYTIVQPPTDTDENNPIVLGTLVLTEQPDIEVITFTQAQINHHKIAYKPPDLELGITTHILQFNQAPEVFVGERFSVIEGEKSPIESVHISANDVDTLIGDLLCTIIVQPTSGYVENISPAPGSEKSRSGTAISAFTIKDIKQNQIYYVQSLHKGSEPVEDRFTFRCSDGINFSERHFFPISIIPSNDEKPEIYMREFVVMEGMNIVIDTPILNGADTDLPSDHLTFIISKPPKHGFIFNQLTTGTVPVFNFTLEEIREASSIVYEHDDSETTQDSFDLILTDGKFSVERTVIVMVIPVDDETPRMAINDGLEVDIGDVKVITKSVLKATDLDSEDSTLTYIIRYGPGQGFLQKTTQYGTFQNLTVGMNFTQNEIDLGAIVYIHNGQEGIRDLIKFDVTDGLNPLIDRYFYVTVGGIDMVFPDVVSKGVSLKEGGRVTLTTNLLSTTDMNSPDEHLIFTITRAPIRGHLECTDKPGMPISSFTQLQIAGNKIYYIHTADDEVKMDSFEFEVTDGYNPIFRTFRISITDVDNKKPVVTIHGLVVTEGENKLITPFELTVEDRDTADRLLKFTVTQVPVHGKILFNNTRPVNAFTKQDLNENMISYKHDGTENAEDSFSFTVTDGTHTDFYVFPDTVFETRKPQAMKITVLSVDNGVPQIVVNKGATTLRVLDGGHVGFVFTGKTLKAEDRDSSMNTVVFRVTTPPLHGYIINHGKGNATISSFTQADIDDMSVCYVLKHGDNSTSDMFSFSIQDRVSY
uniref:FRAS1-related extracellular matrix protein N-terminal domain-containing protein n=1 Tax=Knipowitschia caucasica TaxID=637954 RepID=A0AAV2J341_KNICA